jgi:hypothetical protein
MSTQAASGPKALPAANTKTRRCSGKVAKPDFQANDAIDFWDLTHREDWGISELSQLGYQLARL